MFADLMKQTDHSKAQMSERLSDAKAQVRELQTEVKELRKTLGGKAEQKDVAALDTRMDGYATQKDIESTRELLSAKIAQRAEDAASRSAKLEHVTGVDHAGRLVEIEKLLPTMHPSEDAAANYATIDAELKRQHDVAEARHAEHSKKAEKLNGTADARADEAKKQAAKTEQWLERLETVQKGKAEQSVLEEKHRSMQGQLKTQSDAAKKELDTLRKDAEARLDSAAARLKTHDEAFVVLTKEVNLRSSVEEVALMRERLEMCSFKDETKEMVEALRHEATSRLKLLKERVDFTDKTLLRQLEEVSGGGADGPDRHEALLAAVEGKADKEVTERWLLTTYYSLLRATTSYEVLTAYHHLLLTTYHLLLTTYYSPLR